LYTSRHSFTTSITRILLHISTRGLIVIRQDLFTRTLIKRRITNWPRELRVNADRLLGCFLAGLVYGGFYLCAWNHGFASTAESWLWRSSSLIIASLSVSLGLLARSTRFRVSQIMRIIVAIYFVSRTIIIVLSIKDFFRMPLSAFVQKDLVQFFPHLG
jgi:hypothetical protein